MRTPRTGLAHKTRSAVKNLDPLKQNDLLFLRIRTKKHEILVAREGEYMMIVVQQAGKAM